MVAQVGSILTGLALITVVYASGAALWSIRGRDRRWWESGRNAVVAAAGLLGLSVVCLLVGFLDDQFGIAYVAGHSSRDLPALLKASAVWGGQDGSLLLWAFLQAVFAALVAGSGPKEERPLVPWATVFLSLIAAFFAAVTLFLSNPFSVLESVPVDGQGLNPLLRHPGMIFHPPAMYVGYVGLAVPFALALAGVVTRRIEEWPRAARRWTLMAWLFLGVGLLLGMRWAYDVLGWGGYWGWDPVENAGLMPWLTATALLHSLVMQDEGRGFRWWNVSLALVSFTLVLFGTFTTRSGLIQSVHAFARSNLGPYFLGAMGVAIFGSVALFVSRRVALSGGAASDELLSREGMFTVTLMLFLTITSSVLVGSLLPTLTEALGNRRFEAGPDWFDRVTGPQLAALVLAMGVCPLLGRAAGTVRRLRRRGVATLVGGVAVAVGGAAMGFTRPFSLVGFAIVGLAGGTAVGEMGRGVRGRKRRGEGVLEAARRLFGQNQRRYGGYLVHVGVILLAIGVIGTRFYAFETEAVLSRGESVEVQGYTLTFEELEREVESDRLATAARVAVYRDGREVARLGPRLDDYRNFQQTVAAPAVRAGMREDLYVVLAGWAEGGARATLKVFINPLASFLWLGGLVLMAGGAVATWPESSRWEVTRSARRRRRLWRTAGLVAVVVLLAAAAWAMWGPAEGTAAPLARVGEAVQGLGASQGTRPRVGDRAPEFAMALLDGSTLRLAELKGEVTVINFWSPQCQPCEEELPDLQGVWEAYGGRGMTVVGISFPELEAEVREMVAEFGITYPNGLDGVAPAAYGITGVPETFVVGPEGRVRYVHIGPVSAEELRREVDGLLEE
ncbi:MAG: cytochrome c-type biogenesis CcmF C-terminal domain-containing protein [Chloroflexota bacterium]